MIYRVNQKLSFSQTALSLRTYHLTLLTSDVVHVAAPQFRSLRYQTNAEAMNTLKSLLLKPLAIGQLLIF